MSATTQAGAAKTSRTASLTVLAVAVAAGAVIRLAIRPDARLGEDEAFSVTFAVQKLPLLLVQILRYDIHPPLYYLQLHAWALASHAELWFRANSVCWGLAAIASLWAVLRRSDGALVALAGAAFLAVLPAGLWMSQEIRSYAMLSVLLVWSYAFAERAFGRAQEGWRSKAILLALCVAIVWSHAIGFLAVLAEGLFALGLLAARRAAPRAYRDWALVFGLAAASSLPVLASTLMRDAGLHETASPVGMLLWCADAVNAGHATDWTAWTGLAVYLGTTAAGLAARRTRLVAACFLLFPMLVAAGLEAAVRPFFKPNFYGMLAAPFLALVLARLCAGLPARLRPAGLAAPLVLLSAMSIDGWPGRVPVIDFPRAARDIRADAAPGDVVWVPQLGMFLGMAWYLAGPDWGSPLEVSAPPNAQWRALYAKLGPALVDRLQLLPRSQSVALPGGLMLMTGDQLGEEAPRASRVWLLTLARPDLPAGSPPDRLGALERKDARPYGPLIATRYE